MYTILLTNCKTKNKESISLFSSKKDAKVEMQILASEIISDLSDKESNIYSLINDTTLKIYTKHKNVGWFSNHIVDHCIYVLDIIPFNKHNVTSNSSVETQTKYNQSESNQFTQTDDNLSFQHNKQSPSLVFIDELRAKLG